MTINVSMKCPFCSKSTTVSVDKEAFDAYKAGINIAEALPTMSLFDREVLKTGMCYDCQERTFGVPAPGHEEAWGERLGECGCCGAPIYSRRNKDGYAYVCKCCGCHHYYEGELKEVDEGSIQ